MVRPVYSTSPCMDDTDANPFGIYSGHNAYNYLESMHLVQYWGLDVFCMAI